MLRVLGVCGGRGGEKKQENAMGMTVSGSSLRRLNPAKSLFADVFVPSTKLQSPTEGTGRQEHRVSQMAFHGTTSRSQKIRGGALALGDGGGPICYLLEA